MVARPLTAVFASLAVLVHAGGAAAFPAGCPCGTGPAPHAAAECCGPAESACPCGGGEGCCGSRPFDQGPGEGDPSAGDCGGACGCGASAPAPFTPAPRVDPPASAAAAVLAARPVLAGGTSTVRPGPVPPDPGPPLRVRVCVWRN